MKIIRRCLIWVFVIAIFILIVLKIAIETRGKDLLAQGLSKATGQQVAIKSISMALPLRFQIDGFTVNGIEPAKEVYCAVSWAAFFHQNFQITRLEFIEPNIKLIKDADGKVTVNGLLIEKKNISPSVKVETPHENHDEETVKVSLPKKQSWVFIKELVIDKGRFYYANMDKPAEKNSLGLRKGVISDLNGTIEDIIFPLEPVNTSFAFVGKLKMDNTMLTEHTIQGHGSMDIISRNMKAQIKVLDSAGKTSLKADLVSNDNDMDVVGQIQLSDFQILPSSPDEEDKTTAFGPFNSVGMDIGARFSFQTKMDEFQLRNVAFSGTVSAKDPQPVAEDEEGVLDQTK